VYVKPFRYERAASLTEAADALRALDGGGRLIAGGQSLMPMMNLGLVEVDAVVDISRAEESRGVAEDGGYLRIGALTRHRELERDPLVAAHQPLLAAAASNVGSARVRNRGTLGATYEVTNGRETRSVPVQEFHVTYFTTSLADDEVIAAARVPKIGPGWGWGFVEVSRRPGDFAIVAAAALVRLAGGEIVESRLVLGGVSERPLRLGGVESSLTGARAADVPERVPEIDGLEPMTDTSATGVHRKHLSRVLAIRALQNACARAEEAA